MTRSSRAVRFHRHDTGHGQYSTGTTWRPPRYNFFQITQIISTDLHQMYKLPCGDLYDVRDLYVCPNPLICTGHGHCSTGTKWRLPRYKFLQSTSARGDMYDVRDLYICTYPSMCTGHRHCSSGTTWRPLDTSFYRSHRYFSLICIRCTSSRVVVCTLCAIYAYLACPNSLICTMYGRKIMDCPTSRL